MIGQGVSSRSSHSAAAGRMVRSANSWTHFWICSWSSFSASEKSPMVNRSVRLTRLLLSNIPRDNRISSLQFCDETDAFQRSSATTAEERRERSVLLVGAASGGRRRGRRGHRRGRGGGLGGGGVEQLVQGRADHV